MPRGKIGRLATWAPGENALLRPGSWTSAGVERSQDDGCDPAAGIPTRAHMARFLDLRLSPQRCHIRTIKPCLALRIISRLAGGGMLPTEFWGRYCDRQTRGSGVVSQRLLPL